MIVVGNDSMQNPGVANGLAVRGIDGNARGGTPKAPPACGKQRAPVRGGRRKRLDSRNCFNHPTAAGNADRRDLFASQFRSQVTSSDFPRFCQSAYGIAVKRIFSRSGVRLRK